MSKFKKFILINIILILTSCGVVKEGFSNQKKNNSDEFLVEKKSPLVLPPDYDELLVPKNDQNEVATSQSAIKNLINKEENENNNSNTATDVNVSFEEFLLKKIKNN